MIAAGQARRRAGVALALAGAGCLAAGLWLVLPRAGPPQTGPVAVGTPTTGGRSAVPPEAGRGSAGGATLGAPSGSVPPFPPLPGPAAPRTAPVSIDIPAIGVHTPLVRLHLSGAGVLVPPADFDRAGWYAEGPAPGQPGPAVLAGHVDSVAGPAVFYRLAELAAGAEVLVRRAGGSTLRYLVSGTMRYPKEQFPTDLVYAPVPDTELRLITCGGTFDRERLSYRDNIVVTAVAVPH